MWRKEPQHLWKTSQVTLKTASLLNSFGLFFVDVSCAPRGNTSSRFHRKSTSSELFAPHWRFLSSLISPLDTCITVWQVYRRSQTPHPPLWLSLSPPSMKILSSIPFQLRILYGEFLCSLKRMMDGFMCLCLNVCAAVCFCVPETSTDSNESVCVIKSMESYQSSAPFFFFHTDDDSMITFTFAFQVSFCGILAKHLRSFKVQHKPLTLIFPLQDDNQLTQRLACRPKHRTIISYYLS